MFTARRLIAALTVVVLAALLYTGWKVWRLQQDLSSAQSSGQQLVTATRDGDRGARNAALSEFLLSTRSARENTSGTWWGGLSRLPVVGDDVDGLRALSRSLDVVARRGVDPLIEVVDSVDQVSTDGRFDVGLIDQLRSPVATSSTAFREGYRAVAAVDSTGFAGPLKTRYDDYAAQVRDLAQVTSAASTSLEVLPGVLGADGPRNYLVVFQNNAEIRATGGLPGSWAEVRSDDGSVEIVRQGTASEFPRLEQPILPLTGEESAVYSDLLGVYFQDANFTPDFQRAAALMSARWEATYEDRLAGVISLDPVALSYLLDATGPVKVQGATLTAANVVEELLNKPYLERDAAGQDEFFAASAREIFDAVTGDLRSPLQLVRGLSRAADERRFLFATFDPVEDEALADAKVRGVLPSGDGDSPYVFVGLNDATGSKMSYYLRYNADVEAQSCSDGVQKLNGSMSLNQTIVSTQAAQLPEAVTGRGDFGTERGSQLVVVRIHGPAGGTIGEMTVDGAAAPAEVLQLDGRPVVTLVALVTGPDDVVVNWSMTTGPGQEGDGRVDVTPSVVAGTGSTSIASAC